MSNYPDNFSGSDYDRMNRLPEDVLPSDANAVYNAQETYREIAEAIVGILKKRGYTHLDKDDVSARGLIWDAASLLYDAVRKPLSNLEDEGFMMDIQGDDHEQFFGRLYSRLKGVEEREAAIKAMTDIPVKPSARMVESAIHMANTELARKLGGV